MSGPASRHADHCRCWECIDAENRVCGTARPFEESGRVPSEISSTRSTDDDDMPLETGEADAL